MSKAQKATRVAFRLLGDGNVIALFPDQQEELNWRGARYIGSYMHVGQHGAACGEFVQELEPATPEQYAALKAELEAEPYCYQLKVIA